MKAGKVVLNMDLKPSKQSLTQLQKDFNKIGATMYKPFENYKKFINHQKMFMTGGKLAKSGSKAAGSILGSVLNATMEKLMEPLETLNKTIEMNNQLLQHGNTLGIGASKQQHLNSYFSNLGIGKDMAESIQSTFASLLESGKLFPFMQAGDISNKGDTADKLQSFIEYLSKQTQDIQSIILKKVGFSNEETNTLYDARKYSGEDTYKQLASDKILQGNYKQDRGVFLYNRTLSQQESLKALYALNNNRIGHDKDGNKISALQEYMNIQKAKTTDFQVKTNSMTPERLASIKTGQDTKNKANEKIAELIQVVTKVFNDLVKAIESVSHKMQMIWHKISKYF